MDGHQYEYQCAKILKNKGFSHIGVTEGSGDQGIDIIAYSGGKKYGIQCKYYSSPVGNHAVQEVFTGARYYRCDVAVVMTNSTFTKSAKELANKTGVLLWGNNSVPQGVSSFWLTKFIGIVSCLVSVFNLLDTSNGVFIKTFEYVPLILGGLCSVFEYRQWGMPFFHLYSF